MVARVALRDMASRHGAFGTSYYPLFLFALMLSASFYAFNSTDGQLLFLQGGSGLPLGFGWTVRTMTMALALVAGMTMAILNVSMASLRSREMATLLALGATRPRIVAMMALEEGVVLVGALVAGIPIGVLFSHALVFVTAFFLSSTVVGFGPFLSLEALSAVVEGFVPVVVLTLLSCLAFVMLRDDRMLPLQRISRGLGRDWHLAWALALLLGGFALCASSLSRFDWVCIRVVRHKDGWVGTTFQGEPLSAVLLLLGIWCVLCGLGGVLSHLPRRVHARGRVVARAFALTKTADLICTEGFTLSLSTIMLTFVVYQLVEGFTSAMVMDSSFDVPATLYLSVFSSFVLLVSVGTNLASSVGTYVAQSSREYLALLDLGIPQAAVLCSQRMVVLAGFGFPTALSLFGVMFICAWRGMLSFSVGVILPHWIPLSSCVLCVIVLAVYLLTALGSVANTLRSEARASQHRW